MWWAFFSPFRSPNGIFGSIGSQKDLAWKVTFFGRPDLSLMSEGLKKFAYALPKPRFEGYQARSLQQQKAFTPARGWYVATTMRSSPLTMSISISARALLDLLSGRITQEQFVQKTMNGHQNQFKFHLDRGEVITSLKIEPGSMDEDDDRLVIEFSRDPSAAPLFIMDKKHSSESEG